KPDRSAATSTEEAMPAFYEVTIDPDSRALTQGNQSCLLQPGMEGSVDIVTREETVLQFLLRKARLITDL
ncbi:MAG TPA: HlyD family secretion protein, partial [Allocoleopsis sp.]